MKTWILAVVMMFGLAVTAQEKTEKHEPLRPEQRVELRIKKMDLALGLNDNQKKELQKLFLEQSKKAEKVKAARIDNKKSGKILTADEQFAMQSKALDERIAMKEQLKKILTPEQFAKWETMKKDKRGKITKKHKNLKKEERR